MLFPNFRKASRMVAPGDRGARALAVCILVVRKSRRLCQVTDRVLG